MTKSKKRIIIDGEVLVMPHFSGVGHYTLEMVKALDRQLEHSHDFSLSILVYFRNVDKMKSYGFKNIKIIPSPFSLRIANGLKIRAKQPPIDLLFGKGIYLFPNFTTWPLARSKSVPFIYDVSYEKYPQFAEPRNQAFLSKQVKKSAQRAAHIVTISESAQKEICEFYQLPLDTVGVYYPAVDTSSYYERKLSERAQVKEKYILPEKYILFVGNIEPRKNLKNLLLAYEELSLDLRTKYPLVLVGAKGWQDEEIHSIIARLKQYGSRVILPSQYVLDEDLPAVYSGASIFVYPSIYEGFGIPPLEAMACGVPVVCADNSSLPEVVGHAALTVDALSTNSISSAIDRLLRDTALQELLRLKGLKQVEKFSWDRSAALLLKKLGEIS